MKYTYEIAFRDSDQKSEIVESNYLPRYVGDYCEFLEIIGKECAYRYYTCEVYIKSVLVAC